MGSPPISEQNSTKRRPSQTRVKLSPGEKRALADFSMLLNTR